MKELNKHRYFAEDLTEKTLIDDNSLYAYGCIVAGRYGFTDPMSTFAAYILSRPTEWTSLDLMKFVIAVANRYDLKISKVEVIVEAVSDTYQISEQKDFDLIEQGKLDFFKKEYVIKGEKITNYYTGAYAWANKYIEKEKPFNFELQDVLKRLFAHTLTLDDMLYIIDFPRKGILFEKDPNEDENEMASEFFRELLEYASVHIDPSSEGIKNIEKDFNEYVGAFIDGKLKKTNYSKSIGHTTTHLNLNVLTFQKHKELFSERLKEEWSKFGNEFIIRQVFEDAFPHTTLTEEEVRDRYRKREFLFFHTLFAFKMLGLIDILTLGSNWDYHEDFPLTYEARVRLLPPLLSEFGIQDNKQSIRFDLTQSILYVQDKEVKVKKFGDQYHTLRIMFQNPEELKREWFFSEIAEKYDQYKNYQDKKFYNAFYQLNLKSERVGMDDLFITTRQSVKINPKYLS